MDKSTLKQTACDTIDSAAEELNTLSQEIWKNPELADEEFFAHDLLTGYLERKGFNKVEKKWLLETAFRATFGDVSTHCPHIVVISEYDALPGIGHACGHNLIAEVGIAAGLGIKAALEKSETPLGRHIVRLYRNSNLRINEVKYEGSLRHTAEGVEHFMTGATRGKINAYPSKALDCTSVLKKLTVMGTPAEERYGGKTRMINAGAFKDVDVAMMAHPSKYELLKPNYTAIKGITINYTGRESHAAEWPWQGINALDAAVLCYQNISCLRQQMVSNWQVHGIISNGRQRPNIIPGHTQLEYYIRCPTVAELNILEKKIVKCAEAAAHATGCDVEFIDGENYESLMSNDIMVSLYEKNGISLGIKFEKDEKITKKQGGSSDMGNVSHAVPSIHPEFRIGTDFNSHTQQFTPAAGSPDAQPYTLSVAKALAMAAIDILTDPELLTRIQKDFQEGLKQEQQMSTSLL